jgi:hypothetical protein
MHITQSHVSLLAEHHFYSNQQQSLKVSVNPPDTPSPSSQVSLSAASLKQYSQLDQRTALIKSLLESMLGYKIKFWGFEEESSATPSNTSKTDSPNPASAFSIESQFTYNESESTQFKAAGTIKTADGREIQFSAELSLSRNYHLALTEGIYSGNVGKQKKDPLVINYAAPAATLSQQKFSFDLGSNGKPQPISLLKPGSAFLALDRNHDGKITQGSELFGTQNGDGFADLAQLDEDKNGWIDEHDSIFSQLKLWVKDDAGHDQLINLNEQGIGALFLGNAKANFDLNDQQNNQQGQIRASGLYLRENGTGGSLQQIDLNI